MRPSTPARPALVRRSLLALVLALGVLAVTPAPPASASPGAESGFVSSINGLRSSRGLGSLTVSGELTGVARSWAGAMADAGQISHNGSLSSQVSLDWQRLGENVGVGATVSELHAAFVASPSHLANLVEPSYTHIGVGVVERNGLLYTAHVFVAMAWSPPPPPPPPPPAPPAPDLQPAPSAGSGTSPSTPSAGSSGGNGPTAPSGEDAPSDDGGDYGGPVTPAAPAGPGAPPAPPAPDPLATLPSVLTDLHRLDG